MGFDLVGSLAAIEKWAIGSDDSDDSDAENNNRSIPKKSSINTPSKNSCKESLLDKNISMRRQSSKTDEEIMKVESISPQTILHRDKIISMVIFVHYIFIIDMFNNITDLNSLQLLMMVPYFRKIILI